MENTGSSRFWLIFGSSTTFSLSEFGDGFAGFSPVAPDSLASHRVSDNAGGVKQISSVLVRALGRARHFALVEELPYQPRLARNPFQVRNSVRPMHLFGHNLDHDYYFRLPGDRGAGYPINYSVFKRTPSRCPGCPACEPNFFNCS
jgi:hypothetical protein